MRDACPTCFRVTKKFESLNTLYLHCQKIASCQHVGETALGLHPMATSITAYDKLIFAVSNES